ncbi:unnamed protein product [Moneuplotes crassus]|uniref:Uncharacterized protein n=1 Tax=Euplotes crassus TaxID=5936 RepID=A0AAD2D1Y8_EUPCR|nr:unnamed protein product [Moneuplotes crassus]
MVTTRAVVYHDFKILNFLIRYATDRDLIYEYSLENEMTNIFSFMCTILLYKMGDPRQNKYRLFIFSFLRCLPCFFYFSYFFGPELELSELKLLFAEFVISFMFIISIPHKTLARLYSNIIFRSTVIFTFGNLFASDCISVLNSSLSTSGFQLLPLAMHITFLANTFIGPDFLESRLFGFPMDMRDVKACYSAFYGSCVIVLGLDYFMSPNGVLGQWTPTRLPGLIEDPLGFYKCLGVYYAFGGYMIVTIGSYP